MKELDLLVENYFTPALDATDILRLVEQVMNEPSEDIFTDIGEGVRMIVVNTFPDHDIDVNVSESDPRLSTIAVPTYDREEVVKRIQNYLHSKIDELPEELRRGYKTTLYVSSNTGNIIGTGIKKGRRVVVKYIFKPTTRSLIRNKGDVAEGILGAAMAASFIKGGAQIAVDDVKNILEELDRKPDEFAENPKKTAKVLTKEVTRVDKTVDTISCVVRLSTVNFNDLMNADKRSALENIFKSAVAYANSEEPREASFSVANNGEDNKVAIVSDGVSGQTNTKIDVKIFLDGKATSIGRISLKAGSTEQLGQVGGSWEGVQSLFKTMFDIEIDDKLKEGWLQAMQKEGRTAARVQEQARKIYKDASEKIDKLLNPPYDDTSAEIDLIRTISAGINYQVALKEEGVLLVHLSKGEFEVLDFAMLEDVLRKNEVDMASNAKLDGLNPVIEIVDKKDGDKPLFQIRFKQEGNGKTIRHYVEKKKHMVNILAAARKEARNQSKIDNQS